MTCRAHHVLCCRAFLADIEKERICKRFWMAQVLTDIIAEVCVRLSDGWRAAIGARASDSSRC